MQPEQEHAHGDNDAATKIWQTVFARLVKEKPAQSDPYKIAEGMKQNGQEARPFFHHRPDSTSTKPACTNYQFSQRNLTKVARFRYDEFGFPACSGLEMEMRPLILRISMAAAFTVVTAGMALAQVLVVPGAQTNAEGSSNNGFPFNTSFFAINAMHYQQVYGAGEFTTGPIRITGISFRPDASVGGSGNWTIPTADIRFSTTTAGVDALSLTFANNVGADDTLVRSGSLSISSAFSGPVGGPKVFDIFIPFTTSFIYDPSQGNLLMDVFTSGASSTFFDYQNSTGDAVSRIGTSFGNPNSPVAEFGDSGGLVTQFHYEAVEAVPEPGTMALMGLGALAVYRKRKKSK